MDRRNYVMQILPINDLERIVSPSHSLSPAQKTAIREWDNKSFAMAPAIVCNDPFIYSMPGFIQFYEDFHLAIIYDSIALWQNCQLGKSYQRSSGDEDIGDLYSNNSLGR